MAGEKCMEKFSQET